MNIIMQAFYTTKKSARDLLTNRTVDSALMVDPYQNEWFD